MKDMKLQQYQKTYPVTRLPLKQTWKLQSKKQRKDVQIKPVFDSNQKGYDRVVVTPTHVNMKQFKGFKSESEADIIGRAIGLHELENHHVTSFYRSKEDAYKPPTT